MIQVGNSANEGNGGVEGIYTGSNQNGLQDEIKQQWVGMVAYSIIRRYPCNSTAIRRKKKGSKIKGKNRSSIYKVVVAALRRVHCSIQLIFKIVVGCSQINILSCRQKKTESFYWRRQSITLGPIFISREMVWI
jgi:hypothetical protein